MSSKVISSEKEFKIKNKAIVYFYNNNFFLHKKMKLVLEKCIGDLDLFLINIDHLPQYKEIYAITTVPTLLFFNNRKQKYKAIGIVESNDLKAKISDIYTLKQ